MRISDWSSDVCSSDLLSDRTFLIGGSGWDSKYFPANVRKLGHVPTADHNAFNTTPLAVLTIARDSMAATGYSPATRVFEAAGAAACLFTGACEGIDLFLDHGRQILVAMDGIALADLVEAHTPETP